MDIPIGVGRRGFVTAGAGALLWALAGARPTAASTSPLVRELVAAHRILARHGAAGRVSVRHDRDAGHFLMARGAGASWPTPDDVVACDLSGAPIEVAGGAGESGLARHAAIYRAHPEIRAIAMVHGARGVSVGAALPEVVYHAVSTHEAAVRRIRP